MKLKRCSTACLALALAVLLLLPLAPRVYAEAGNSFGAAQKINVNTNYTDAISSGSDEDYFVFTLSQAGTITVKHTHKDLVSTALYWRVILYNDRQTEICRFTVNGNGTERTSYLVGLGKGTYYLRIVSANSLNKDNYTIRVNFTATNNCEKEINDDYASATAIATDTDITGSCNDSSDEDYYSFSLPRAGAVTFTFRRPDLVNTSNYWVLHLYNDRQKQICRCFINGNEAETTTYLVGLDKGNYFVEIRPSTSLSTNTYQLRVNFTPNNHCEKELNEDFASSTQIPVDEAIYGSINSSSDKDYYTFTLTEMANIRLRLNHADLISKSNYWLAHLYNDRQEQLGKYFFNADGSSSETEMMVLKPGKYYVDLVKSTNHTTGTYALTVLTYCSGGDECPGRFFTDMPAVDNWAHEPIDWAVENKITAGTSKTTFSPASTCTRAQVVTFLWRAKGQPTPKTRYNPFQDVSVNDYYYKAVLWAVENKITAGTSRTTFSPNSGCTRGQVVTFLWRMEGQPIAKAEDGQDGAYNPFKDVKQGDYYYDAVLWAVEQGITKGTGPDTFAPGRTCTRAQIVSFLHRDLVQ